MVYPGGCLSDVIALTDMLKKQSKWFMFIFCICKKTKWWTNGWNILYSIHLLIIY